MNQAQLVIVCTYSLLAAYGSYRGYTECIKKNAMGLSRGYWLYGAFVWADMLIFGIFWVLAGVISLIATDWTLFLLIIAVFWLVRSIGETIYWFNQQFSTIKRNPPERLLLYKLLKNDSVWFAYQIFWQCMTVICILLSIYLGKIWLSSI